MLFFQNAWFRKSRFKSGKGKSINVGGKGLGFRERPGLGSSEASGPSSCDFSDIVKSIPPRTGPGSDRLSAVKAAFKAQYMSQVMPKFQNYISSMAIQIGARFGSFHFLRKKCVFKCQFLKDMALQDNM